MKIIWKPVVRSFGGKPKKTNVTEGRLEGRDKYAAPILLESEIWAGERRYKLTMPGDRPKYYDSLKEAKDAAAASMQDYQDTLDRIEYVVTGDYLWDRPENAGATYKPPQAGTVVPASLRHRFQSLNSALAWVRDIMQEQDSAGYIFRVEAWRERDGVREKRVHPTMIRDSRTSSWREESAGGKNRKAPHRRAKRPAPSGALTFKQFAAAMKARKIGA